MRSSINLVIDIRFKWFLHNRILELSLRVREDDEVRRIFDTSWRNDDILLMAIYMVINWVIFAEIDTGRHNWGWIIL